MNHPSIQDIFLVVRKLVDKMAQGLAQKVSKNGCFSQELFNRIQPESFVFARTLAEIKAAEVAYAYADTLNSSFEKNLAEIYTASALKHLITEITFNQDAFSLSEVDLAEALGLKHFVSRVLCTPHLEEVGEEILQRGFEETGNLGISEDHEDIRSLFARVADERLAPLAESIHRKDGILPEDLLAEYAELGVFGISIPEEYGGNFIDNMSMCLATEELSRGSLGAGGSVITRPEICAKALLKGGSEGQKQKWLPQIAAGEKLVSVAVTEPNAGSDVANVRVTAKKVSGGYLIHGEKTWCTFAGRANVFILLARTGGLDDGYKGLTLFLVEKPATISETEHHSFVYQQPEGGRCEGHAIPTIGYRGMHSFAVTFEDYFVPDENRVGEEGKGFYLQMEGFAGGRIQTASRAVGLMEASFRTALSYTKDRHVFGQPLSEYSLIRSNLAKMSATILANRQLSYHVARLMDEGQGSMEASLVKLIACKDAEWIAREAMQIHGGMGYSEEYACSRYWIDARVLSIFEGAEEVLALYVVARQVLRDLL